MSDDEATETVRAAISDALDGMLVGDFVICRVRLRRRRRLPGRRSRLRQHAAAHPARATHVSAQPRQCGRYGRMGRRRR